MKAPFPYFGGKAKAAPLVWRALGDPGGYVEPFCGSAAVLLNRPAHKGRRVETINDADGWLVNAWRAIRLDPAGVAHHAAGPVTEIDYHARLAWLQDRRTPELVAWLEGDPENHDSKAAGWWLYVSACGIGDPWGPGPWRVIDGYLSDSRERGARSEPGRKLPHITSAGQGVNRELPHITSAGQGVNRELPHITSAGQGVNRKLPHLGNAGRGVNRALPHLGDAGKHETQVVHYLSEIASRLERVRITCGSWERVVKPSGTRATMGGDGSVGIFLDPPYATSGDLYATTNSGEGADVAHAVRDWCATADPSLRIVLCGYDDEHDSLGWESIAWKSGGGYGGKDSDRERLWLSPSCIGAGIQDALDFGEGA